jgi:hypothetical protein
MQGCVYACLLGAYVCRLIEIGDCRAVVLGCGAFVAVCLVPMRWLDWRGGSISLSIPFTFFFNLLLWRGLGLPKRKFLVGKTSSSRLQSRAPTVEQSRVGHGNDRV